MESLSFPELDHDLEAERGGMDQSQDLLLVSAAAAGSGRERRIVTPAVGGAATLGPHDDEFDVLVGAARLHMPLTDLVDLDPNA